MQYSSQSLQVKQDVGYAWVVLLCCVYINTVQSGTLTTYGILLPDIVETFQVSKARGASTQAMAFAGNILAGFMGGWLVQRFNGRNTTVIAALVSASAFIVSAFINNLNALYITYGLIPGCAMVIYRINSLVPISVYFSKRRALAMSLVMAGISLGFLIWAPLFRFLLIKFGRGGAMMLFSSAHLHCIPAGLLLCPPSQNSQPNNPPKSTKSLNLIKICSDINLKQYMTLSNLHLWMVILSISILMGGHIVPYYFLPARVMSDLKVPAQSAALLVSILGIGSIITRPIYGVIGDKLKTYRQLMNAGSGIVSGAVLSLSYSVNSFLGLAVIAAVLTITAGYTSLFGTIVSDLVPMKTLPLVMGILGSSIQAITTVVMPVAGWLADVSDSYATPFLVFGLVQIIGGCIGLVSCRIHTIIQKRQKLEESINVPPEAQANNELSKDEYISELPGDQSINESLEDESIKDV